MNKSPRQVELDSMTELVDRMRAFVEYRKGLDGYEKGEAQIFCDRLFQAFGHGGVSEAGASLEFGVKKRGGKGKKFADLLWRPRVLIEMKGHRERLEKHYRQAFDYWTYLVPERPRYVVLCNFDEFWIYDFNTQLDTPVDVVPIGELPERFTALNFLFPSDPSPVFNNDRVRVTREAASQVASVFNALVEGRENKEDAQRFILQCVVAMFSEDFELLPRDLFTSTLIDCVEGESAYDLIGGLFRQMGTKRPAKAGRFRDVHYFNGGLFATVEPVELGKSECEMLLKAASEQWSRVAPPIFGTLFQSSMNKERRHAIGAHFTNEADIQEIVAPTIVAPWQKRIEQAETLAELEALASSIRKFKVLDPACGSGNFLYVAFRELVRLEMEILSRIHDGFAERARSRAQTMSLVSTQQFFGIDKDPFAAELAKVTLMLAKRIAIDETKVARFRKEDYLPLEFGEPLPLDNLDENICAADALFCRWPRVDAIIGNPPFQAKNNMQAEFGPAYVSRLRDEFPEVPGRADYCVYWFRKTHDELSEGQRAGLVGTNTIRQNYSRQGGLEHIVDSGGVISQAWSTKVWSGDASVHVSIVNWVKGVHEGKCVLFRQEGDSVESPLSRVELERISPTLSGGVDVTKALKLVRNTSPKVTHQGQTQGHEGYLLAADNARRELEQNPDAAEVLLPFVTIDELLTECPPRIARYVIDFHPRDLLTAQRHRRLFAHVEGAVLDDRKAAALREEERNLKALQEKPDTRVNKHHANFLKRWWQLSYPRGELKKELGRMQRYIACGRVTKRPVFVMLPSTVRPSDALQVFALQDDYSFGILQSRTHWEWFTERCSTFKGDYRYTPSTVFDSFPWPQGVSLASARSVAEAGRRLRELRHELVADNMVSLRNLYRSLELPGEHPLKNAHDALENAVRSAYGMSSKADAVGFLFDLNQELAKKEKQSGLIVGPGLPPCVKDDSGFITQDTIRFA